MSTSTRVIKNTGFLYLRLGLSLIISLWTTRIVLEALGVDNFGIYNVVGGVISMLGFLNATLSTATQRYINYAEGQNDINHQIQIFNNSLILHLGLCVILLIVFAIAGIICFNGLLDIPHNRITAAKIVYGCMIGTTLMSVMNVPYEASINAHEDMVFYAYVGIIDVLAKLGMAFLIKNSYGDRLVIYGFLKMTIPFMTFIMMRFYCHQRYKECIISLKRYFDRNVIKDLTHFAGGNFTNSASGIATQYGFNVVINHFFGVALNAAQGIAMQVSGVLVNISSNALKALNPIIIKSESANQRERMIYVSLLGCRVTFFIFTAFSIPLVYLMDNILHLWLKVVPQWAVIFCQLQLIRICIEMLTYTLSTSIMAQGNIKQYNIYKSIINFLPLPIIIILFNYGFAPYWMYIIWTVCWSILGGIVSLVFAHRNVRLSYKVYYSKVLLPSTGTVILPITVLITLHYLVNNIMGYYIIAFISEVIFLVISWHLLFMQSERIALIAFTKRIFNKSFKS